MGAEEGEDYFCARRVSRKLQASSCNTAEKILCIGSIGAAPKLWARPLCFKKPRKRYAVLQLEACSLQLRQSRLRKRINNRVDATDTATA